MKLVEISALATDSELKLWQASCETISHQISLKMARKEGGIVEILNSVISSLPRKTDAFRSSAISSDPAVTKALKVVTETIGTQIPIQIENGWKKSVDFKKHVLVDSFSILDDPQASEIFKLAKESRAVTEQDVEEYFEIFDKKFGRLLACGKPQFEGSSDELTRGKYANVCVEVLVAIGTAVGNAQKITELIEKHDVKVSKMWMTRIPDVFEQITELYDYPTLFDIATSLEGFPLRKVFLARQFACQALVNTFVTMAPNTKYNVRELVEKVVEKPSRFLGHASELGHEPILCTFSSKAAQTIEDSRRRLEVETIERLRKCGYLENLGSPPDELVRAQIESILEILPHFSKEFVHLSLRHFSYDSEVTLANLLSRENLPIELLRLENVDLKSGVGSGEWPPLDFTASDEIEKAIRTEKLAKEAEQRKQNEQKTRMNLFSLAPILSDRPPSPPVDSAAELRARAELYRTSVLTKLHKMKAESSEASSERLPADAENLVPMLTSKKYSALNSLKISEADKVAIRPTYDKYRYETPSEGGGVYDDEYDDEFDGREFNVERLNQELETSSEEDEAASGPPTSSGAPRGDRGRGGARGGRGGASEGYTGGRDRQQKERHKSDFKQRGADRKKRGVY